MANSTRYQVSLFHPDGEFFTSAAVDLSEREAIAYAVEYNGMMNGEKIACIAPWLSDAAFVTKGEVAA